jgi:hypothetical protein
VYVLASGAFIINCLCILIILYPFVLKADMIKSILAHVLFQIITFLIQICHKTLCAAGNMHVLEMGNFNRDSVLFCSVCPTAGAKSHAPHIDSCKLNLRT